jgi:hypothetical protein
MELFLKEVLAGSYSEEGHKYFKRFGRGTFPRRFAYSFQKGTKIKMWASYELANEIVKFVQEQKDLLFSGKIISKEKIAGVNGRKKAGTFVYEVKDVSLKEYPGAYFYLLDAASPEISLRTKKSLPKPGKDAEKIDDKFCALELDLKYWPVLQQTFFWDVADGKKVTVEHNVIVQQVEFPAGEKDPVKIRDLAKKKGKIIRRLNIDGKESAKESSLIA